MTTTDTDTIATAPTNLTYAGFLRTIADTLRREGTNAGTYLCFLLSDSPLAELYPEYTDMLHSEIDIVRKGSPTLTWELPPCTMYGDEPTSFKNLREQRAIWLCELADTAELLAAMHEDEQQFV